MADSAHGRHRGGEMMLAYESDVIYEGKINEHVKFLA